MYLNENVRPCPKCGPGDNYFSKELIAERLSKIHIDPVLAAEETVYKSRLDECEKCEALSGQVLCAHCGCFVMFRARPRKNRCPHPEGDKWRLSVCNADAL